MKNNRLHILTLTWNNKDKLTALKQSLEPALSNIDYTWYIRDNASTDGTVEEISTWDKKVKVFAHPHNKDNFAQGMNYLYQQTNANDNDYVLLLNNDIIINDKSSIKNMISIMDKDDDVGVVGAKLLYTNTNKIQHAGVVFHNYYRTPMHFRANEEANSNDNKDREFQIVTGAVLLTQSNLFKSAYTNKNGNKGMDESLVWMFDDCDFCLNVKYNLNKKVVYCGSTNIYHEESASLKKNPVNKLFLQHNLNYFKNKWQGRYKIDELDYKNNPNLNIYKSPK